MEIHLNDLLERIKSEGVESAESEAKRIIASAERRASEILETAETEATAVRDEAERHAERSRSNAEAAMARAARDLILNVQGSLRKLFEELAGESVGEALSAEVVANAVVTLLEHFSDEPIGQLKIAVSPKTFEVIDADLRRRLAREIRNGLAIEAVPGIGPGFRLVRQNGTAYYDFGAGTIAEIISHYLDPRLAARMKAAMGHHA